MVGGVHTLKGLKRIITEKLGMTSQTGIDQMILHLVQPSGQNMSSSKPELNDHVLGTTEGVAKHAVMLCRIESLEEVMPDDCIEILTVEQEKQALQKSAIQRQNHLQNKKQIQQNYN